MKYIVILAIIILVVVAIRASNHREEPVLPEPVISETALAGPTEAPTTKPTPTAPTTRVITKNNMKIEITKEGTGAEIVNGQTAVVTYVGKLTDGTVFDASKNHGDGSFSFVVGNDRVIQGWHQGIVGMKVGEHRTLTIPPELGYGPNGMPPVIPANATLVFDVVLLVIK